MSAFLDASLPLLLIIAVGAFAWFVLRHFTWRHRFIGTIGVSLAAIVALAATSATSREYVIMGIVIIAGLLNMWFHRPGHDHHERM